MIIHTAEQAISRLPHVQLDSTFSARDILHMVLAGGPSQTLYNLETGQHERAVDFLCLADSFPDERENEFLGTLAVAGVAIHRMPRLASRGRKCDAFAFGYGQRAQLVVDAVCRGSGNDGRMDESSRRAAKHRKILRPILQRPYGSGSCFGTHAVEAVAFALSRYCQDQDVEPARLRGIWQEAYTYVLGAVQLMKKNQREDGSIDRCWFRTGSFPKTARQWEHKAKDLLARHLHPARAVVYPTGHCLDAVSSLSVFFSEDRNWIESAGYIVAQTIESQWTDVVRDIPPFTHAVHALKLLDL